MLQNPTPTTTVPYIAACDAGTTPPVLLLVRNRPARLPLQYRCERHEGEGGSGTWRRLAGALHGGGHWAEKSADPPLRPKAGTPPRGAGAEGQHQRNGRASRRGKPCWVQAHEHTKRERARETDRQRDRARREREGERIKITGVCFSADVCRTDGGAWGYLGIFLPECGVYLSSYVPQPWLEGGAESV